MFQKSIGTLGIASSSEFPFSCSSGHDVKAHPVPGNLTSSEPRTVRYRFSGNSANLSSNPSGYTSLTFCSSSSFSKEFAFTTGAASEAHSEALKIVCLKKVSIISLISLRFLPPDFFIDYGTDAIKSVIIADIATNSNFA